MAKIKRKRRGWGGLPSDIVPPTPERGQHDTIERESRQIVDAHGNIGRPFRVVDILAMMLRRGSITPNMALAGYKFRDTFSTGLLDRGPRGMRLDSINTGKGQGLPARQIDARNDIYRAMQTLGGLSSPAGICAWCVLGEGMNVREWCLREGWRGRALSQETASGILISVLGVLTAHYGLDESGSNVA